MEANKTHGAFSWNELATPDPTAAGEFYSRLFGWTIETVDMGPAGLYHVAKVGDTPVGGMMKPPGDAADTPTGWSCYVTVADVDKTLALALQHGATPCMPAMDVEGVGRMAGFMDPHGAMINIIRYSQP